MLSYCHRYHAGNFADTHKHMALLAILSHFQKKMTPFCVLDAYSGEGFYDLTSLEIQKNQEYLEGYQKYRDRYQKEIEPLTEVAEFYQTQQKISSLYPGSPAIIAKYLRKQDRAIFTELHPNAIVQLHRNLKIMSESCSIQIAQRDGLEAIKALLPFKEGRGLIFIDPSYEVKTEYQAVANTVCENYSKFTQGIYVIWYPILKAGHHHQLVDSVLALQHKKVKPTFWHSEWIPDPKVEEGLIGSGLLVINPPWQLEERLEFLVNPPI